jgi:outer membrane cobalamin receptor
VNPFFFCEERVFVFMSWFVRIAHLFVLSLAYSTTFAFVVADSLSHVENDSLPSAVPTYTADEIVVTATRSSVERLSAPSRVNVITAEQLRSSPEKNLGEQLVGASGLLVREYGVGALQTLSFRGMGAEQSTILLDGVPINNVQSGVTDLSLVPLEIATSVEMMRDGSSSLYGANALGGAVNVLTQSLASPAFARVESSVRSFGAQRFSVSASPLSSDEFSFFAGRSLEYGRGDFEFDIQDGAAVVRGARTGSDFRSQRYFSKFRWLASPSTRVGALFTWLAADRGTPGPVLAVANQGAARQRDEGLFAAASFHSKPCEQLDIAFSASMHNAYLRYVDRGTFAADNFYRNINGMAQASARFSFSRDVILAGGIEFSHAVANGNTLASEKSRSQHAEHLSAEVRVNAAPFAIVLYPSIRHDLYAGLADKFSPKLGFNLRVPFSVGEKNALFVAHATVGNNFRIPTFNELHYAGAGGIGNLSLVPERSTSFDVGTTIGFPLAGWFEVDVTYFDIATEERIQWLPTSSQTIWSPVNIGRTKSYGVEVEGKWSLNEMLTLEGNYSATNAIKGSRTSASDPTFGKQLLYVPLETGFAQATIRFPLLQILRSTIRGRTVLVGTRFTTEDNSSGLPSYWLANADWSNELELDAVTLRVKYEAANLFNIAYEILPRYPMPLRTHSLSISLTKHF